MRKVVGKLNEIKKYDAGRQVVLCIFGGRRGVPQARGFECDIEAAICRATCFSTAPTSRADLPRPVPVPGAREDAWRCA
jgi:hypothetical protein